MVTQERFAAFTFSKPIVNIPLKAEVLEKLRCELEGNARLLVAFEAAAFDDDASGKVECRFSTSKAHPSSIRSALERHRTEPREPELVVGIALVIALMWQPRNFGWRPTVEKGRARVSDHPWRPHVLRSAIPS